MKNKLCLDKTRDVDVISSDWLFKKKFTTKWQWDNILLKGGHGDLVEEITFKHLYSKYENIKRCDKGTSWDFILKNELLKKIEIRRVSSKNKVSLGFSSDCNNSRDWREKASILDDGGYLFVQFLRNGMSLHYLNGKRLLNEIDKTKYFANKVTIFRLNVLFPELKIPLLDQK